MRPAFFVFAFLSLCFAFQKGEAQSLLEKPVTLSVKQKSVEETLNLISKQGGFFFSYNSNLFNKDSIITLNVQKKTVRQTLDVLFKGEFEYKESKNHIIIQYPATEKYWYVSGVVTDAQTGERVRDVSVFEPNQLVAALTNEQGYFKLKLKDRTPASNIFIRKSWFADTIVNIKNGVNQEVNIVITPKAFEMDSVVITGSNRVEGTWLGKFFTGSKQKVQSMNLSKFFTEMPVQGSVLPGLSSQGKMAPQITNNFSLNMLGGYTAGVSGAEVGGLFNINKKDVGFLQIGGLFNVVGGDVRGIQAAGLYNQVLDTVTGFQMAGLVNLVRKTVTGVQAAGVHNHASEQVDGGQIGGFSNYAKHNVDGIQIAGAFNLAGKNVDGGQIAGAVNYCSGDMDGAQISGTLNICKNMRGVQIGVFNYADTSSGVSIGFLSIVKKGYFKMSLTANEAIPINVSVKTGTHWLYNIFLAGASVGSNNRAYTVGWGWGSELPLSNKFSINPELVYSGVYVGSIADFNHMMRLQAALNWKVSKQFSVFGGPSFVYYFDNKIPAVAGYKADLPGAAYKKSNINYNMSTWVGWNVGINIF